LAPRLHLANPTLRACHALDVAFTFGHPETAMAVRLHGDAPLGDFATLSQEIRDASVAFTATGAPRWPRARVRRSQRSARAEEVRQLGRRPARTLTDADRLATEGLVVAKVWGVVEVLPARIALRAHPEAGVAVALASSGAGMRINELREVVVPSWTVTWRTKV
jgi:hypothetical protein